MNQKVTSCYECIINSHHQAISTRVHIIMSYWILLLYLVMNYKQTIIENASYNNRYAYFPSLYKFRKVSFDPTEPRLNQWAESMGRGARSGRGRSTNEHGSSNTFHSRPDAGTTLLLLLFASADSMGRRLLIKLLLLLPLMLMML